MIGSVALVMCSLVAISRDSVIFWTCVSPKRVRSMIDDNDLLNVEGEPKVEAGCSNLRKPREAVISRVFMGGPRK